jgi:purine/pyrimidine-nucleoside phosphorylase
MRGNVSLPPEELMAEDRFERVTVVKNANVYFDGTVTSRTVLFPDGTRKTLGIMLPGTYEFGTGAAEVMEVLAGGLRIPVVADCCCSYLA